MTDLQQLFAERAARARQHEDVDRVLALVRERAEQRAHRRRNLLAAGGGVAAVAALVGAALVLPGGDDDRGAPAGGPGASAASGAPSSFERSNVLSSAASGAPTFVPTSDSLTTVAVNPSSGRISTLPSIGAGAAPRLVPVTTPKAAPLAVSLVPAGWGYLGEMDAATTYGPPSANDHAPDSFEHKLALLVGTYYGGSFPLIVAGHPARYSASSDGADVAIRWSKTIQLDVQFPSEAVVTREQALQIANTLAVRDLSHPAKG